MGEYVVENWISPYGLEVLVQVKDGEFSTLEHME